MLFLRVIAWYGAEKFSLKKSCFYLYIRRHYVSYWAKTSACQRHGFHDKRTENAPYSEAWIKRAGTGEWKKCNYLGRQIRLGSEIYKEKQFIKCPIILAERADPATFCNTSEKNKKIFEKYYPLADGYIFQTEDARNYYEEQGINTENSVVIPNAINPEFIRPPYQGERRKVIVGAGRLTKQKNFSLLIRAFAEINKDFPEYVLEIYGDRNLLH